MRHRCEFLMSAKEVLQDVIIHKMKMTSDFMSRTDGSVRRSVGELTDWRPMCAKVASCSESQPAPRRASASVLSDGAVTFQHTYRTVEQDGEGPDIVEHQKRTRHMSFGGEFWVSADSYEEGCRIRRASNSYEEWCRIRRASTLSNNIS